MFTSDERPSSSMHRSVWVPGSGVLGYLASGMTYEEILNDFPYLTKDDILACLEYAAERERHTTAA